MEVLFMILNFRWPAQALKFILIGISSVSTLAAQPSASLRDQLTQRYTLTRVDPDGTVTQAGTVVSVGHLLWANPVYGDRYQPNTYKNGRVSHPVFSKPAGSRDSLTFLRDDEKMYITSIDVNDADIVFHLQTLKAFIGNPVASAIYRAALSFQFQKGFVSPSNITQIENTIGAVLTVIPPGETSVESTLEPPEAPTVTPPIPQGGQQAPDIVHVGQTVEEVKALLGQPDKMENVGGKLIYSYTGLTITFTNGKVSDVR
jgi:hypothetical protein